MFQIYHASKLDGTLQNVTLFSNTLDSERKDSAIQLMEGNNGGSFVVSKNKIKALQQRKAKVQLSQAVLLSDIFSYIVDKQHKGPPLSIVMKVDIEQ